jgi:hypothetical protein
VAESLFPFLHQTMESTCATLRGLQRDVAHHTDLTPEIDALTEAIKRLGEEADRD